MERNKVEVYAELAKVLFENLFGVPMRLDETSDQAALGDFMAAWVNIERDLAAKGENGRPIPIYNVILKLHEKGKLTRAQLEEFREVQQIRNGVVHGEIDPKDVLNNRTKNKLREIGEFVGSAMAGFVH